MDLRVDLKIKTVFERQCFVLFLFLEHRQTNFHDLGNEDFFVIHK